MNQEQNATTSGYTNTGAALNPLGDTLQTAAPTPPTEPDKVYNISISQADHGYIINVGCKVFAIESAAKLSALLSMYLHKPHETLEKYFKGDLL
jgi:hypothetical protein